MNTSAEALDTITQDGTAETLANAVESYLLARPDGATAGEVAADLGESGRKRLDDLRNDNRAHAKGRRVCPVTGMRGQVWYAGTAPVYEVQDVTKPPSKTELRAALDALDQVEVEGMPDEYYRVRRWLEYRAGMNVVQPAEVGSMDWESILDEVAS